MLVGLRGRAALAALLPLLAGCGRAELLESTAAAVIEVSPESASVQAGATLQFTASVTGLADTSVAWAVQEGDAGGTVSASGLYTAPAVAGTYHVVAHCLAADRAASAAVAVTPAPPPVTVSISPTAVALLAGRSAQLTASVTGTTDTAVWWWLREGAAGGTVTSDGLYTAPAAAGTYHVVVTSQADPSRSAEATATVSVVGVSIAPAEAALVWGEARQFTATVTGTADTAVDWSVEEGAAGGTVTSGGLYTAPAAAGTFHVVARSQADPVRSARAAVAVTPPPVTGVTVAPSTAALLTGRTLQLAASVLGGATQAVDWSVQEGAAGGTVTASGLYTAPPAAGTFHVVATSRDDPAWSGAAVVTVTSVGVSLSPSAPTLLTGRTQQFTATVTGTADTAVAWSVQEGAAGGTVTSGGLYAAPATAGTFHVVATSHADPTRAAVAAVTVRQVAISIAPANATLLDGLTRQFTATVTGTTDTAVAWSVQEGAAGGTVTSGGLYTAPATAGTFHVVATSLADPARAAVAAVTVERVAVSLSPAATALAAGQARQLTATVTGTADQAVDWSVQEGAAGGTVSATGLYTAPWAAGTFHVVAASRADPRRSATATISVSAVAVSVAVSPESAELLAGDTLRLTATVTGSADAAVAWSVLEGIGCGTVVDGRYTAPDVSGTCHVVATSLADPTRSASATVTVAPSAPASIWEARLGIGVVDGGPLAGTWDLDPAGHPDTLIVVQTPNAGTGIRQSLDVFFGPVGGPMAQASLPIEAAYGVAQVTALMDTASYKLHALAPAGNLFSLVYVRAAVLRGADGRITGFAKEAEVTFAPFSGNAYGDALAEVVDGAGNHRLAGVVATDDWYTSESRILGFVTSVAGGVTPTAAAQFTGLGGGAALDTLATFEHTGGPGALDGAYGCMSSVVQQPTTGTIYAFSALGLHGESSGFHRIFAIPLTGPGATTWGPAAATNYSDTGTGANFAVALPSGHVYWSWEDGTDSRISRIAPDGTLNLAPLPAIGFRAEFDPGACHVAVQGDRLMTILHEWGPRTRVYLATGVDHDAAGTSATPWSHTELTDPVGGQYPLIATGLGGLGRSGGHWWTALLSAHYSSVHVESWLVVAPFP